MIPPILHRPTITLHAPAFGCSRYPQQAYPIEEELMLRKAAIIGARAGRPLLPSAGAAPQFSRLA